MDNIKSNQKVIKSSICSFTELYTKVITKDQ